MGPASAPGTLWIRPFRIQSPRLKSNQSYQHWPAPARKGSMGRHILGLALNGGFGLACSRSKKHAQHLTENQFFYEDCDGQREGHSTDDCDGRENEFHGCLRSDRPYVASEQPSVCDWLWAAYKTLQGKKSWLSKDTVSGLTQPACVRRTLLSDAFVVDFRFGLGQSVDGDWFAPGEGQSRKVQDQKSKIKIKV